MCGSGGNQQDEVPEAMRARVQASFERQAMMATLGAELVSVERFMTGRASGIDGAPLPPARAQAVAWLGRGTGRVMIGKAEGVG